MLMIKRAPANYGIAGARHTGRNRGLRLAVACAQACKPLLAIVAQFNRSHVPCVPHHQRSGYIHLCCGAFTAASPANAECLAHHAGSRSATPT